MARNSLYMDLTGMRFGLLKVVEKQEGKTDSSKSCYWLCKCECGNVVSRKTSNLKRAYKGAVPNCGCLNRKRLKDKSYAMKKHGMTRTKIFSVWGNMLDRCNNPNNFEYHLYGGRGIKVCDEWNADFLKFYDWAIKNGYVNESSKNRKNILTLDRIDVNGNYEPDNCRWITAKQQIRNRRNTIFVELNGKKIALGEVCENYNVDYQKMYKKVIIKNEKVENAIVELGGIDYGYQKNALHD